SSRLPRQTSAQCLLAEDTKSGAQHRMMIWWTSAVFCSASWTPPLQPGYRLKRDQSALCTPILPPHCCAPAQSSQRSWLAVAHTQPCLQWTGVSSNEQVSGGKPPCGSTPKNAKVLDEPLLQQRCRLALCRNAQIGRKQTVRTLGSVASQSEA